MLPLNGQAARPEVSPRWRNDFVGKDVHWLDNELPSKRSIRHRFNTRLRFSTRLRLDAPIGAMRPSGAQRARRLADAREE